MSSEDQVEIEKGDWKARFSGHAAITALFCIAATGFIGYLIFEHDARAAKFEAEMRKSQEEMKDFMAATLYVLSLSPERREQLNLAEPQKLREMKRW